MANISLSGLNSGIDTASIIEKLMQVEQRKITLLNNNLAKYSDKKTALTELESKVNTFKTALGNLSSLNKLKAFNTTTGDSDIVTASASASATEGSHSVQIKQLATAERMVHSGQGFSSATSLVNNGAAGTFIYSYNYQEVTLQVGENTTLQELVTKINGDSNNPGITASLLEYNDGNGRWHLVLAGKDTGSDNHISINAGRTELKTSQSKLTLNSGGSNAAGTTRIKDLAGYTASTSVNISGARRDSTVVNINFAINNYTTVEDLMDQIETTYGDTVHVSLDEGFLKVTDKTSGDSNMEISLAFTGGTPSPLAFNTTVNGADTGASLAGFEAGSFTRTQEAKDALIKVDGYPLGADNWIARQTNSISDVIDGVTLNLQTTTETAADSNTYNSVSVSMTRNTETVKENINAMISAYNAIVNYIKEKTTYDAENKKMGILSDSYSVSNIRTLITSPLRSVPGGFTASDTFTAPQDIGMKIKADGTLELDSKTFDDAVSENYASVLRLIGAQQDGTSSGGDAASISFYGASQFTKAGSYNVRVNKALDGTITAQIKLTTEDWSKARQMTVEGNTLYGKNDRTDAGDPLYPEYSMALTLDPDIAFDSTSNTTINVRQGFGSSLHDLVTQMTKSKGRIDLAKTSINKQISDQQSRIDNEETRLEKYQQRLQSKYARLESTLNAIQQQMSSLNAML